MASIDLRDLVTSGGDERLVVDPRSGRNRYHLDPLGTTPLLHRGSCTASPLSGSARPLAEAFAAAPPVDQDQLAVDQAHRLRTLFDPSGAAELEVCFAPSGTDCTFHPLVFQALAEPGRPVRHLLSCPEELGAGSRLAAAGQHFSSRSPRGAPLIPGTPVCPGVEATVVALPARDASGAICDRRASIEQALDDHGGAATIVSLVYGSKSGIEDDLEILSARRDDALFVVDLCQLRVERDLVAQLVGLGALVSVTGSKFFQAPPFAAALLMPRWRAAALADQPAEHLAAFGSIFTSSDLPPALSGLRSVLPAGDNLGLRLRWEVALAEMQAYDAWPAADANAAILRWNGAMTAQLEGRPSFALMPDQSRTNPSIISFQVRREGRALSHHELQDLHRRLATEAHPDLPAPYRQAFCGQPVAYGAGSFLRLAIGSPTVRQMLEGRYHFDEDLALLAVLEELVRR